MIYLPPPQRPDPPAVLTPGSGVSTLEQVLGERTKLKQIQQKNTATYPPAQGPRKKAFSSRPTSIDI